MTPFLIIFIVLVSVIFALLEIQIEGENGWAGNLPTWKIKNPFKKIINWPYLSGYHFYVGLLFISLLQLPFFIGVPFNLKTEVLVIEVYLLIILLEDFLWFVLNPKWGIKKFFTKEIPWHSNKVLFLPRNYWVGFISIIVIELLRKNLG